MNYAQTDDDFMKIFIGKYISLISACQLFDKGHLHEAKEMAVKIRTLLHDTSNSTSILSHLKKKSKILFINTRSKYHANNLVGTSSLNSLQFNAGLWTVAAYLNPIHHVRKTPFDKWWGEIILSNTKHSLTRRELILSMSDKDGGAHVDTYLKIPYAEIAKKGIGWKIGNQSLIGFELYSVRQISHEILLTLGGEFKELERYLNQYNEHIKNKVNGEKKSIEYEIEAEKQLQNGNFQDAIDLCETALTENQLNFNAMGIKQVAMGHLGRLKELVEFIEECLLINPENTIFLNNLAHTNLQLKDYNKVLEITEKILDIEPENISNLNRRAISYAEIGDTEKAKITLMKGFNLDPTNTETLKNLCHLSCITNDKLELKKFTDILKKH